MLTDEQLRAAVSVLIEAHTVLDSLVESAGSDYGQGRAAAAADAVSAALREVRSLDADPQTQRQESAGLTAPDGPPAASRPAGTASGKLLKRIGRGAVPVPEPFRFLMQPGNVDRDAGSA